MNKRAKQRLVGVTILVIAAVAALIFFTRLGNATATNVTIADVVGDKSLVGKQVQVSGKVVAGSWISGAKPFVFEIEDDATPDATVKIIWNDVVPGSFGDGTTATVTGTIAEDGSIEGKYLVTKCPSKYQSATGAMTVNDVINRADELTGATVKVTGFVIAGTIKGADAPVRFSIADSEDATTGLDIAFRQGLSDEVVDGAKVVLTGSMEDGIFNCAEVALDKAAK